MVSLDMLGRLPYSCCMNVRLSDYRLCDLAEGQSFSFLVCVETKDIDRFAELSGDISQLHMDPLFAESRGFRDRVAHGALLMAYVSRMVGVHFPGTNSLLQTMNVKFLKPVYANDTIRVRAVVKQTSPATNVAVLNFFLENPESGDIHARGTVQVGFTREASDNA
ncbi:MAG TPA: MaoC family dehydratase [Desulfomonilaceae bacterium]|nr:MaoC family dehydratase [Desulfomonilaceae bacterium]